MEQLSDQLLLESYQKAYDLELSEDFLELMMQEIERRKILYKID